MSQARNRILAALGAGADPEVNRKAAATALLADLDTVRPALDRVDIAAIFTRSATASGRATSLASVASLADLPAAAGHYLIAQALPPVVVLQPWPELLALDWGDLRIATTIDANTPVAVSFAHHGIAETGSLVLYSGRYEPVLFNFLPLHHIVVLRAASLCGHLEDAIDRMRLNGDAPRTMTLISGASGTTDIEGVYVHGAHGPGFMHIVVASD